MNSPKPLVLMACVLMFLVAGTVSYAVFEWTGGTDNTWSTATNWTGGVAPAGAVADSLSFGTEVAGDHTITGADGAYTGITAITFNDASGAYSITGTGSFSLDSGATFGGTSGFTQTIGVDIVSNAAGGIDFIGTDNLTLNGVISGDGGITQSGTGNLTLSGTNTYSGGTTVSAGTLTGTNTSLQGDITNNAAVVFDQAGDGTYADVISGTGTLTKSGAGNLTLSGINTYSGATTLSAGTLNLGGQVSGNVAVNGGTLMGTGTIAGGGNLTLNNGGSFAPGNSIGTTTVTGDYVQNAGSTLEIEIFKEVDNSLSNDQIAVTGTATLEAGSTIEVTDLTPSTRFVATGDQFDIITTGGGVTDNGATITSLSASLSFAGSIVGNDYILTATRSAFTGNAVGSNNAAVLGAIDADLGTAAGDFVNVVNALSGLTAPQLNAAAEQLLPLPTAAATGFTSSMAGTMNLSTATYLSGRRQEAMNIARYGAPQEQESFLAMAPGSQPSMMRDTQAITPNVYGQSQNIYAQPFGMYQNQDSTSQFAGFSAWATGVSFGIDNIIDDQWIVGLGATYMHSWIDFDNSLGDGEIDSFRVGPYISYFKDNFYVDAMVGFGYHVNETSRNVVFGGLNRDAEADYDSYDLTTYLGGGYDFDMGEWTFTTTGSFQYTKSHTESFRESGAGAAGLDVDSYTQDSLISRVGFRLHTLTQWDSVWVRPEVFAGYAHEFIDEEDITSRLLGGTTKFTTNIDSERDDSFYVGTGLNAAFNETTSAFVRYESEFYSGNNSSVVTGGVTFQF